MKKLLLTISLVVLFIEQTNLCADILNDYKKGDITDAEFVKNIGGKFVTVAGEKRVRYNYYPNP